MSRQRQNGKTNVSVNVTDANAGVDARHSGQGHEESDWDGGREEYVFCFCSPCVTSIRQQWLGHEQDVHKRNSRIRKKLYRKFWSMQWRMERGAWGVEREAWSMERGAWSMAASSISSLKGDSDVSGPC